MLAFLHPTDRKSVTIVGIGTLIALAVLTAAIVFAVRVRSRAGEENHLATAQQQLDRELEGCAAAEDPEACRLEKAKTAATSLGSASLCASLEGSAFQSCVWDVAYVKGSREACESLPDRDERLLCEDSVALKRSADDPAWCEKIQDKQVRARCEGQNDPCADVSAEEQPGCEANHVLETAVAFGDSAACEQIMITEFAQRCLERLGADDADQDGLTAAQERTYGTNSQNKDSDGDAYLDGEEVQNGYDPLGPGKLL